MTHRLAGAVVILALAAAPARAQPALPEQDHELELGGGWMLDDPLDVPDLEGAGGPTATITWTRWRGTRGVALGVTSIFGVQDDFTAAWDYGGPTPTSVSPVPHVYPHAAWRRRWMNAGGRGFLHFGVGAGPLIFQDRIGPGRYNASMAPVWHVEVMATRTIHDGIHLRFGGDSIQWLFVPLTLQGSVKLVWGLGE